MSGLLKFANNAVAPVPHGLGPGDTVLHLAAGDGNMFPTTENGYFKLTLEDRRIRPVQREIVHCVDRTGDQLVLQRGMEGTLALTFFEGFVASNRVTAASLNTLVAAAEGLGELWLGVHPIPPTIGNDGGPIPIGALYYNPLTHQTYAWDGTQWRSQFQAAPAVQQRLFYVATAGQVNFGDAPDIYGLTLNLNDFERQPVMAFVNGEAQFLDDGTGTKGTYIVDWANNRVTFNIIITAGYQIELDQLVPRDQLAPTVTDAHGLDDISAGFDGVETDFNITGEGGGPVIVDTPHALQIFLDGVRQRPVTDFTVVADQVRFAEAPPAGTTFWGEFYGQGEGMIGRIPSPTADGQVLMSLLGLPVWQDRIDEGTY